jgi:hypothetical protein
MAYQDLLKDTSIAVENNNYFIVTIADLDLNTTYPIQFRWKFKDGTFGIWGATKIITTTGEIVPGRPNLGVSDVVGDKGFIKVTWNGNDSSGKPITNIDRVDIYIDGSPFNASKPSASFKTSGTQTIVAPAGQYIVALYAVTNYGSTSPVSTSRTVTVTDAGQTIISPEDPDVPTLTAGLASIIVSWNGKKLVNGVASNFSVGAFASAKVYVGTSAGFVPSDNNWVHSLNFANGTNQVSIGVGTVIDKSLGTKLEYGVPYYVKIKTVNAAVPPVETSTAVSSSPTNITVDKVAASEIKTGTLSADASITAGIDGGSRVVLSGGANPFLIYGTNGTTELLKFTGGATGTLTINGGGTFTGDLSAGSGSSIFKSDSYGIYLGNATESLAPFSVSRSGVLRAAAGTIGGWQIAGSYLQNTAGTFQINSNDSAIYLGSPDSSHIRFTPSQIAHYNGPGAPSGKFTLTTSGGALTLSGDIKGSNIYGSTLTTSDYDTGERIVVSSSTKSISFFNSAGNGSGHIQSDSNVNQPGVLIHTGSSANISSTSSFEASFPQINISKNLSGSSQSIYLWLTPYGASGIEMFNSGSYSNIKIKGNVDVSALGLNPQLRNIETISTTQVTNYGLPGSGLSGYVPGEGSIVVVYTP